MQKYGVYTLANDVVFDQLVALLNSIEANVSSEIPICVIPYNNHLDKVKQELETRPNVTLFDNQESLQRWENFAHQVWASALGGNQPKIASLVASRKRMQRRYAAFDGDFEKFVVYDADSLAMKPLTKVFEKLSTYDFVFDDWEHKKTGNTTALKLDLVKQSGKFSGEEINSRLHCASFFGSKYSTINQKQQSAMLKRLIKAKEVKWLNGISEAFLFNYMTLDKEYSLYNFTLSSDGKDKTGNCTVDPFVNIDNVLYNQQGLKPIHRLHFMDYPASDFAHLSQGKNVGIPYQDIFLHYRFLKNPDQKPKKLKSMGLLERNSKKLRKMLQKQKARLSRKFSNI